MKKNLLIVCGIILIILSTSISIPVNSEINKTEILGRTHLRAIGRYFHICDEDGGLYGHILIGLNGFKLVFNEDIYIPNESIIWIIMTKNMINCVYKD